MQPRRPAGRHNSNLMPLLDLGLHLKFAGFSLIVLGISHAWFEKLFDWRAETARLSRFNQQVVYVHNFFIGLICVMMGAVALLGTRALTEPTFAGSWICGGLTIFWACRLGIQLAVYDARLRRGKVFETTMHWCFALGWIYLTGVFGWAWRRQIW